MISLADRNNEYFIMSELVTIRTFVYPHDLHLVKVYLESRGIECFVKDEFIVQAYHLFSPAVGGIKLQVWQEDFSRASAILIENGYIEKYSDEDSKAESKYEKWERRTSKIPLIGKWRFEHRLLMLVISIVALLLTVIYLTFFRPVNYLSSADLDYKSWCVEEVLYHGKELFPKSIDAAVPKDTDYKRFSHVIKRIGRCKAAAYFEENNTLHLPGFDSPWVKASWFLKEEYLEIANADTFRLIYNGIYRIKYTGDKLKLISASTTIYLKREPQYDYLLP